jgi:hypothetical protein
MNSQEAVYQFNMQYLKYHSKRIYLLQEKEDTKKGLATFDSTTLWKAKNIFFIW